MKVNLIGVIVAALIGLLMALDDPRRAIFWGLGVCAGATWTLALYCYKRRP